MIKTKVSNRGKIKCNNSYVADSIEVKIKKVVTTNEPIDDSAPIVHTERKDGVRAEYDVRTDRFEIAQEAMGAVAKSHLTKREARHKIPEQTEEQEGIESKA